MTRRIVTLAVAFLICDFTFALDCPITVNAGDFVEIEALYAHEAELAYNVGAGRPWVAYDAMYVTQSTTHYPHIEGVPVAIVWYVNGDIVKQCGIRPVQVFREDFELGHLDRWSATFGG